MKPDIRNNKDFWPGVMFFGIGAGAILIARNYPFGSSYRMGPGSFPILLGGILIVFGIYIMARGLRKNEKMKGGWPIRAWAILPLSVVVFGILMESVGFIPALVALIFLSAASGKEFNFKEVLLLSILLVALSTIIFIWGLNLPYSLINRFG